MNINQAKALAWLPRNVRVTGRDGAELALKALKVGIVQARRLGDDLQAGKLSEAKEVFRKRLVGSNRCEVCGNPIAASETSCRLCLRPKALPLPAAYRGAAASSRPPAQERKLTHEAYALCGYWTPPVQKVVRRWRDRIGQDGKDPEGWCKHYIAQASWSIKGGHWLNIQPIHPGHMGYLLELLTALHKVWSDKASPYRWLLQYGNSGKQVITTDGVRSEFHSKLEECDESRKGEVIPLGIRYVLHSYQDIRELILRDSGPAFSADQLCTAARRLRLTDNFAH